jgi:hypothetical protein
MRTRIFATILLALACAVPSSAQETTGSIEGIVRDSGGAVLPGVAVSATGPVGTVTAVTDMEGHDRFPRLPSVVTR